MRFTSLHLTGFKSFVDPTILPIEPGLTGIVGPNGCGKSNLVEALRWVLGETSAKAMRGGEMDDVIFSGTAKRSPRAFAEVGLDIDNSTRRAPAGLNDSDLLRVARRIQREQGSVYRVNGKETRARDVHTLFADLATGADSPALVRQGRIAELINAKPQARRLILEEAAGTAGLHARRHEAELRLKAAEANLLRLDDVVQQIEQQITQLKRQARQATRYRNLALEIRKAEAILLHLRWTGAKAGVDGAEQRLEMANDAVTTTAAAAAHAASAAAACAEGLPALRQQEAEAAAALQRLTMAREALIGEARRVAQDIAELTGRIGQITGDLQRETGRRQDSETALARLDGEYAVLASAKEAEAGQISEAAKAAENAGFAVKAAETDLDGLSGRVAALAARRQSLERDLDGASRAVDRLDQERRRLEGDLAGLGPAEDAADRQAATDIIQALDTEIDGLRQNLQQIETERAQAQSAEAKARQEASIAEAALARLSEEERGLSRLLATAPGGRKDPGIVDRLTVAAGYERALGAALGDDLTAPLDPTAPIFWQDLGPLDDMPALPADVIPLAAHVTAPPALARRLSQIGLISADQAPDLVGQLKPGQRLVSVQGHLWRWDGYGAADNAPSDSARRMVQRNRLKDLTAECATAAARVAAAAASHQAAQTRLRQANDQDQALRAGLKAKESDLATANRLAAERERASLARETRRQALRGALDRLHAEWSDAAERRQAAGAALDGLEPEQALRAALAAARLTVDQLRARFAEARGAQDSLRREIHQRAQRLTQIGDERRAWADRQASAVSQIQALTERRVTSSAECDRLAELPDRLEADQMRLADEIAAKAAARLDAADALARAEAALAEADRAERAASTAASAAREARAHEEGGLQTARDRLVAVEDQIREVLNCPPNQALLLIDGNDQHNLPGLEQIEIRLDRLRRERDAMGPVNLRAEAELAEKEGELATLLSEKAELDAAIAKLKGAIRNLNKEGRDRLTVAFDKVNDSFGRLFTHLFQGGEAHLKLTESDDPLEAGLEIYACPPGKKLQVLSLFSGGEQTLTALALIFAVFLTNPAPICVLDEVDAPLDDANVERFCNLLDEMTRLTETRFLVITHHGITMARMNRLFGVTMIERGISQLVSVDLGRAERLRAVG